MTHRGLQLVTAAGIGASIALTIAACAIAGMFTTGCAAPPAVVPVTPENAQTVSSCQGIEQARGLFVGGDFVFTGGAAAAGVVAAALPSDNASGKTDLAIAAAGAAAVSGVLTGLVAYESGAYASGMCQSVLGPLPPTPFGTKQDGGAP